MGFEGPRNTYSEVQVRLGRWQEIRPGQVFGERACGRCGQGPCWGIWGEYKRSWKSRKLFEQQNDSVETCSRVINFVL